MTDATKNPAPDRAGNTGLMWALGALVCSGTVDGGTEMRPRMEGIVVVVVVGAGVAGVVMTGDVDCGTTLAAGPAMDAGEVAGGGGDVVTGAATGGVVLATVAKGGLVSAGCVVEVTAIVVTDRVAVVVTGDLALVRGLRFAASTRVGAAPAVTATMSVTAVTPIAARIARPTHLGTTPVWRADNGIANQSTAFRPSGGWRDDNLVAREEEIRVGRDREKRTVGLHDQPPVSSQVPRIRRVAPRRGQRHLCDRPQAVAGAHRPGTGRTCAAVRGRLAPHRLRACHGR